jgi:ribonuclease HI
MTSPAPSVGGRTSPALQANNAVAGSKRKRPSEKKVYAVKEGRIPGVYSTWNECLDQVRGHRGAEFKSFHTREEAQDYIAGKLFPKPAYAIPGEQRFYGVQRGVKPGVYTDWPTAQAQIRGFTAPKYKKFNSRAEAEAFVNEGNAHYGGITPTNLSPEEELRQLIIKRSAPGLQTNGPYIARDKNGDAYDIGNGPLPPGAEDGFDPNIKLNASGELVHKTDEEKARTKLVPREKEPPGMLRIYTDGSSLRNGQAGARAGVGVYFGPQDPKYDTYISSFSDDYSSDEDSMASIHYGGTFNSPITPPTPFLLPPDETVYRIDWPERAALQKAARRRSRYHKPNAGDDADTEDSDAAENKGPKLTNWRYRNVSEALKGNKQTNQRAELTAVQRALEVAPRHRDVTIYTDSRYAIDCVTNWYKGWERNGWRNSKGKPVENMDLVKVVRALIAEREEMRKRTLFVWVKGHAGDEGNTEADRLAVAGSWMERDTSEEGTDGGKMSGMEDDGSVVSTKKEEVTNGLPGAGTAEDDDVKQAFNYMAASMDEDGKNGSDGYL